MYSLYVPFLFPRWSEHDHDVWLLFYRMSTSFLLHQFHLRHHVVRREQMLNISSKIPNVILREDYSAPTVYLIITFWKLHWTLVGQTLITSNSNLNAVCQVLPNNSKLWPTLNGQISFQKASRTKCHQRRVVQGVCCLSASFANLCSIRK